MNLKPKTSNIVKYTIPSYIRENNPLFAKFLEYYYQWSEQTGNPADFLHNIAEYRDIDQTSDIFAEHIMKSLVKVLPPSISINKKTLSKNIKLFFESKGTEDSFKFIMNAIFNETAELSWERDTLFRASGNQYECTYNIVVESDTPFIDVDACEIIQDYPMSRGIIESCVNLGLNNKTLNIIKLNDKTVNNDFIPYSDVKILKRNIDRSFYEVTDYYNFEFISLDTLVVSSYDRAHPSIIGTIIRQVGSDGYAVVESLKTVEFTSKYYFTVKISGKTGTWGSGEVYFISPALLNSHFTKHDYFYGVVNPIVGGVDLNEVGQNYMSGLSVEFIGGSGQGADATISHVTAGSVEDIRIIDPGSGFTVGEQLVPTNIDADFDISVKTIDGIGAAATFYMELEGIQLISTSTGVAVNDKLTTSGGVGNPIIITVNTVSSTGNITSYTITNRGNYSICPDAWNNQLEFISSFNILNEDTTNILLEDGTGLNQDTNLPNVNLKFRVKDVKVTNPGKYYSAIDLYPTGGMGTGAELDFSYSDGVITNIPVSAGGTGYTKAYVSVSNSAGIGLNARCNLSGGAVSSITIFNGGAGYSPSDTFTIVGNGASATIGTIVVANGCVTGVGIIESGSDYAYDTTISYTTTNPGAVSCSLTPVITEGKITGITIISPGSGYGQDNNTLVISSGTNTVLTPVIEITGQNIVLEDESGSLIVESGYNLIQDRVIPSNNPVVGVDILSPGSGYYDPTEITPLTLSISTITGTGAVLYPVIEPVTGKLISVNVAKGGTGYLAGDTVTVNGGSGAGALAELVLVNDSVYSVYIINQGSGYKYGTKLYLFGDGDNFDSTAIVETGITNAIVVNGGYSYLDNTTITVTDPNPLATGADIKPVIIDGVITSLTIIEKGTGYTNPTAVINGVGYSAELILTASRPITGFTINSAGYDFHSAVGFILGDGTNCKVEPIVDTYGSLQSIVFTAGSGYTSGPSLLAIDNSGKGAASSFNLIDGGKNINKSVAFTGPSSNTSGSVFVGIGKSIGAVKQLDFSSFGMDYTDLPRVSFPVSSIISNNNIFTNGETVKIKNFNYPDLTDTTFAILLENGDALEQEETAYNLIQDKWNSVSAGPSMKVFTQDYSTNTMYFVNASDNIDFVTENGQVLIDEIGASIGHENSELIKPGDVIIGDKSGASTTILEMFRATGHARESGFGRNNKKFINVVGILNNRLSKMGNNYNIHDFAYKIKSGLSQNTYEYHIKNTVHPAGYKMFGEIDLFHKDDSDVRIYMPSNAIQNFFTLVITLEEISLLLPTSYEWHSYDWLEKYKFLLNNKSYGNVILESDDGYILSEDGFYVFGDAMETYYGSHQLENFMSLTFENVDPASPNYNASGFYSDLSCEIDIK